MQSKGFLTEANYKFNRKDNELSSISNKKGVPASHVTSPLYTAVLNGSLNAVCNILRE